MLGRQSLKGFTLPELMITIVIVLAASLISFPVFISLMKNYRLSTAAENLYQSLQFARSEAIKRNANVYVAFSVGDNWCYGFNLNSACNCTVPSSCNLGTVTTPANQTTTLSVTGLSGNAFYYEGSHGGANTTGTMRFTVYGSSPFIELSLTRLGNIQMCSNSNSRYTSC